MAVAGTRRTGDREAAAPTATAGGPRAVRCRAHTSLSSDTFIDTIVAISTPPGRGGLGIVRLSGARCARHRRRSSSISRVRLAPLAARTLRELLDAQGHAVDQVVVTFFERAALLHRRRRDRNLLPRLAGRAAPRRGARLEAGARLAEPGEFTLRAFLNGRIDLPQAEAVRDLIEATTLYQARVAAQQVEGSVSRRIAPLKEQLLELIALLEAGIDFAEDDVSVAPAAEILRRLEPVIEGTRAAGRELRTTAAWCAQGLTLAIVGRPNVGKSSLFNRLLEQDRAIVTDIPGTTRDLVSETAAIGGIPVKLVRYRRHPRERRTLVESLGIERSYQAMADADLTLVVVDLSRRSTPRIGRLIARARQGRCAAGRQQDAICRGAAECPAMRRRSRR